MGHDLKSSMLSAAHAGAGFVAEPVSDTNKARVALGRRVALLEAKKPQKATAMQMYFQELSQLAQERKTRSQVPDAAA